jgi:hypothetical protein
MERHRRYLEAEPGEQETGRTPGRCCLFAAAAMPAKPTVPVKP